MNKILITYHEAKETAATAFGIYFKLNSFIFMPVFGLNNGIVPIVAYNFGAARLDRVKKATKLGIATAVAIMTVGLVLMEAIPAVLLGLFSEPLVEFFRAVAGGHI